MRILGVLLAVIGVVVLLYGGITYKREKTVIDMGPIKATATEQHNVPVPPIVGGLALLAGVLLVAAPRKRAPA